MNNWWWLSFANDGGFLGAIIVRASNMVEAVRLAHEQQINPVGEVLGCKVPYYVIFDPSDTYRLLNKEEALAVGASLDAQAAMHEQVHGQTR